MNDFWIILTGAFVAVNCGLLGVYLVLRKMTLVGDAISHAVLPGIVLAYLVAQSRSGPVVLLGAAIFGLFTTFLIEVFHKKLRLQSDASIGITFTWLFAIGVIMVSALSGNVDLDQDCVLYGEIAYVPFDLVYIGEATYGPVAMWMQGGNLLAVVLLLILGYRGLFITSFDPGFSTGLGINTSSWHYVLMGMVSLTVVLSFNAVGAILVVAFLVVPAAGAYLISSRLPVMIAFTVVFGVLSSVGGFYLAEWLNASISGSMATMAGLIFLTVFLFSLLKRYFRKGISRKFILNDQPR
jgi:manganese/zinc/iron transport system permease protein